MLLALARVLSREKSKESGMNTRLVLMSTLAILTAGAVALVATPGGAQEAKKGDAVDPTSRALVGKNVTVFLQEAWPQLAGSATVHSLEGTPTSVSSQGLVLDCKRMLETELTLL
jgi:hypothetical protein